MPLISPHSSGFLVALLINVAALPAPAVAQLNPDNTLGDEASTVAPDVLVQGDFADLIEGGAIRGSNLFHSFSDFNVDTLQRLYFANPAGIETILTRVTGGNGSTIDGTLGVDGLANLYLLNPNGFAFGPNAQLDIRGSFMVSTAEGWQLGNGEVFSAIDPDAPPLLAVTLTPGLQYGAAQQADVTNQGNLAVDPGESLVLLGDTVTHTGTLTAPRGQVQLLGDRVGVFDAGQIDVSSPNGGGTVNLGGGFQGQGLLPTSQQTVVGPNATLIADATQAGDGGEIIVWSDGLTRFYGNAQATGGLSIGNGGFIEISGARSLAFDGAVSAVAPNGEWGTVLFDPTNIVVVEDALAETTVLSVVDNFFDPDIGGDGDTRIAASALANAAANSNVSLQATNDIRFKGAFTIANPGITLTAIAGNDIVVSNDIFFLAGGDVIFEAGKNIELAGTDIELSTLGGNASFTAGNLLSLTNNAFVNTSLPTGRSGNLTVVSQVFELSGNSIFNAGNGGIGDAGDIQVTTNQLLMGEGSQVSNSIFGSGNAGVLTVNARDLVQLNGNLTGLFSQTNPGSSGNAGNLQIMTGQLLIQDDADISVGTFGSGNGGLLEINANDLIQLSGDNTILSSRANLGSSGDAGDIKITTNQLFIQDRSQISISTFSEGNGGLLTVNSADLIKINGTSAGLLSSASSSSSGNAGNIQVATDQLFIQTGFIASGTAGLGNGGDIGIQASRIELLGSETSISSSSNNLISTTSVGDVLLDTDTLILRDGSTVSARALGVADAGTVEIANASYVELNGAGTTLRASAADTPANAGFIKIDSDAVLVQNSAQLDVSSLGSGDAGVIEIQDASYVEFSNHNHNPENTTFTGAFVTTGTGSGNGGRVSIDAERLRFSGPSTGIQVDGTVDSNSGVVDIIGSEITLENSASIVSLGSSGQVQIVSEDFLEISNSTIGIEPLTEESPGSISLNVRDLRLNERGVISAGIGFSTLNSQAILEIFSADITDILEVQETLATFSGGDPEEIARGGNIDILADTVSLNNQSQILSFGGDIEVVAKTISLENVSALNTLSPLADGGNILVQAGESLNLHNQSAILATAGPVGNNGGGGVVNLNSPNITVADQSFISASSFSGEGGNVNIQADNFLLLRNNSLVSASAGLSGSSSGGGGNVNIDAPFVVGVLSENSDIIANAVAGNGGFVIISALDIIGLEFQDELTPFSDITASSQAGAAGITEFNRLTDVNVEEGLSELPVDLADPTRLISQQCALQASDNASEFTVVGRGGLPPDPSQLGTADRFLEDLGTVPTETPSSSEQSHIDDLDTADSPTVIQEAQSWVQDASGHVHLVSATPDNRAVVLPSAVRCSNHPDL
ncbi:MAG: filamentous hemagglutinin N-terminal domain-containing protein [Leptolyngbya sp. SIO1E4]|nr:filamentous hemagglutinin N-terminal domain-containing protein [Leptolyngbya sp. SIO1E4]